MPGERGQYGLNSACIFNYLHSFHCIGQIPTGVMHDFCEKVASHDVMSILKVFVSSRLFTFDEYNKVLREVKLGDYEGLDRLKPVSPKNVCIPGKAMAVALHLRLMPFLVWRILKGNVLQTDATDLVIFARMLAYIMADKLTMEDIEQFEELIVDYFEKRAVCFEKYGNHSKIPSFRNGVLKLVLVFCAMFILILYQYLIFLFILGIVT